MKPTDLIVFAGAVGGVALMIAGALYLAEPIRRRMALPAALTEVRPLVAAPSLMLGGLLLVILSLGVFAD